MKTPTEKSLEAIDKLRADSLLLDASLLELKIFVRKYVVSCELIIKPRPAIKMSQFILRIEGVNHFDFYYDEANQFYLIDRYKIIPTKDGGVYLSLDPYDESEVESKKDCGVIVGKEVLFVTGEGVTPESRKATRLPVKGANPL